MDTSNVDLNSLEKDADVLGSILTYMSSTDTTSRDMKAKAEVPIKSSYASDVSKETTMPATASYTATAAAYKNDSYDYSFTDPLASPSLLQTNTRQEVPLTSHANQASYNKSQSFFPDSPPTKAPSAFTPALLPDQGTANYSTGKQADERAPPATTAAGTDTTTKIQLGAALQRLESLER